MKFSESWLREWVNPAIKTQALVDQLTMAGLEVDAVEKVAGEFSGVVVGEIVGCEQHPDADKLRVCQVAGSPEGILQVVCGAPNARIGIKIPFALVGAKLPPGEDGKPFPIKKAKLRGVESFGMLCGQTELQAGEDDSGVWELPNDAPVGADLREYLNLDDAIIEVDLTPNRSDCLSIKGLAREVGVLNRCDVTSPTIQPIAATIKDVFPVVISAPDACPRYAGRVIKGVDIRQPSPHWLQEKLRRSGLRSVDAVVDVTNYILLELGQPMHAFDLAKLKGRVNPRLAKAGEKLVLLSDQEVELKADTLVIADASGPIAMAGIMGGSSTAVSENTTDIFLESAFFSPIAVAGRARSYGLHTDSSHRFERGVDYSGQVAALERATELLLQIVGGFAGPVTLVEDSGYVPAGRMVTLNHDAIASGLGFDIPSDESFDILQRLGLKEVSADQQSRTFEVPSYRFDIDIPQDLLEELARIYGYNNLPSNTLKMSTKLPGRPEGVLGYSQLSAQLVAREYREVITYSFIDPKTHTALWGDVPAVELLNPISAEMSVMRTSLFAGLLQTLVHNINRQVSRMRIFERGMRFVPSDTGLLQTQGLAGLVYGGRDGAGWATGKADVDFYDIKGDVESLLNLTRKSVTFDLGDCRALHPGQCAKVFIEGDEAGVIGALHPQIQKALGIPKAVFLFELDLDLILGAKIPKFMPLSKFPEVTRDLALVVDKAVPVKLLEQEISINAGNYLKELKVFDVYSGEGIDPQRKSVAFNLTFQHPSRTLNDEDINVPVAEIVLKLKEKFDAQLR